MTTLLFALVVGLADICPMALTNNAAAPYSFSTTIYDAGHVPVVIPRTGDRAAIARTLDRIDVLLLCGGQDVETSRYGEACTNSNPPHVVRDAWEWSLLDEAVKIRLPVVGICRGLQVINVYFGGSLYQDLVTGYPGAIVHSGKRFVMHAVRFEPDSRAAKVTGAEEMQLASWHHQGVKRLAPGFKVAARAPDGFVEAIEATDRPVAGVQFHPELTYLKTGDLRALAFFKRILEWAGAAGRRQAPDRRPEDRY